MAESRPLPDDTVHSRLLDHAADRGEQGGSIHTGFLKASSACSVDRLALKTYLKINRRQHLLYTHVQFEKT